MQGDGLTRYTKTMLALVKPYLSHLVKEYVHALTDLNRSIDEIGVNGVTVSIISPYRWKNTYRKKPAKKHRRR